MSLKLFALNFASLAAAQLTTSMWLPPNYGSAETVTGSVIAQNGDKTTLLLAWGTDLDSEGPPTTVTVGGMKYFEYQVPFEVFKDAEVTLSAACSRKDQTAAPTCEVATIGYDSARKTFCSSWTDGPVSADYTTETYTETYTSDESGPATTETWTTTFNMLDSAPEFCTESVNSTAGDSPRTIIMTGDDSVPFSTFQLVLTAGTEKLASAAATPTGGASSTLASSAKPTGTSGPVEQSTAAAPMITAAPILAGLGAAAAAIFL
jgi:hypothetical protein